MGRPFRLWVRCPQSEMNPDGFVIANTYIMCRSAIVAGRRLAGKGNFHIDHYDPQYLFTAEEQHYIAVKRANGAPLYHVRKNNKKLSPYRYTELVKAILHV